MKIKTFFLTKNTPYSVIQNSIAEASKVFESYGMMMFKILNDRGYNLPQFNEFTEYSGGGHVGFVGKAGSGVHVVSATDYMQADSMMLLEEDTYFALFLQPKSTTEPETTITTSVPADSDLLYIQGQPVDILNTVPNVDRVDIQSGLTGELLKTWTVEEPGEPEEIYPNADVPDAALDKFISDLIANSDKTNAEAKVHCDELATTILVNHLPTEHRGEVEKFEELHRVISAWLQDLARESRDTQYYQSLLDKIGNTLGEEAFISDDGSKQQDVIKAKLPELVEKMVSNQIVKI